MRLNEKLDAMIGKTFMYNTRHYKILSYQVNPENNNVQIATDKKWFEFQMDEAKSELKNFLPVADEFETNALTIMPKKTEMNGLKAILLENIEKVQKDKGYTVQANSINQSMNTLLNMAKLEISFMKLKSKNN